MVFWSVLRNQESVAVNIPQESTQLNVKGSQTWQEDSLRKQFSWFHYCTIPNHSSIPKNSWKKISQNDWTEYESNATDVLNRPTSKIYGKESKNSRKFEKPMETSQ